MLPSAPSEARRLEALRSYDILDTEAEAAFDDLAALAAHLCDTPIALLTLIDSERQWIKAAVGIELRETTRDLSICTHALESDSLFIVPDLAADPRFADNPLLSGKLGARFYAGAPLVTPAGYALGTLCVLDDRPRELSEAQRDALTRLARQAIAQLELRRSVRELDAARSRDAQTGSLLRAALESTADGLLAVDREGRFITHNQTFADLWGIPADVLSHGDDDDAQEHVLTRLRDPDGFRRRIAGIYASPEAESHDLIELRDGRVIERYSRPQRLDGAVVGRVWSFRDVTENEQRIAARTAELAAANQALHLEIRERERAEAELQLREQRFRSLIENASDLITILDPGGVVRYESPAIRALLGYDPEELVGRSCFEYIHPDDHAGVMERLGQVLRAPGSSVSASFRFWHKNGSWRVLEAVGSTLRSDSAVDGVVVNSRDVTERKRDEEALRFHTALLEAQNHTAIDGILVAHEGRVLLMNERYAELFNIPAELRSTDRGLDLLRWARTQVTDPDGYRARVEELRGDPEAIGRDEVALTSGRVLDRYSAPLRSEDGRHYGRIWVIRDITDRKRTEEELLLAKEEAERANHAKSEFLSRMSHELRTPMNSILGFAQLLCRAELTAQQTKSVQHILRAGKHLLNLINEVLDIARIEANHQEFSLEPVRVATALQEALGLIRPLAAQHGSELREVESMPECYLRADRQRLTQVLLNLLSNAVKYNRPGGQVQLTCHLSETRVRIGVHDTGSGIPADRLDELFVPFARLGAEQSRVEGTGLGLALSRRLVEAMDGWIEVESTVGVGSTFWIDLPRAESPLAQLDARTLPTTGDTPRLPTKTILYIEDNLANWTLVETIFSGRPEVQLIPALQGRLGIELAREHMPDLILLDLHLPDIPGEVVLRDLRAHPRTRTIPVLVISADATRPQIERLLAAGAERYLTKPLDIDEFLDAVHALLDPDAAASGEPAQGRA